VPHFNVSYSIHLRSPPLLLKRVANFKTHVGVAFGASSLLATVAVNAGLFSADQSPWYVSLGVIGGMLPDIDSDHSRPVKKLFTGLALCFVMLIWQVFEPILEPRSLAAVTAMAFAMVRYPALYVFQKMTVHRGVFHSLLAGLFFALILICIRHYMRGDSSFEAWLSGVFLLFGFLVHLILDEMFSVDLANGRMKRSFGTALKLYGYQNVSGSILMLSLSLGLFALAPSSAALFNAFNLIDWANAAEIGLQFDRMLRGVLG